MGYFHNEIGSGGGDCIPPRLKGRSAASLLQGSTLEEYYREEPPRKLSKGEVLIKA